jgi:hypothetical protein
MLASSHVRVLPSSVSKLSALRSHGNFAAQYPPYTSPCPRFACAVTLTYAGLGASMVGYPFTVEDFHLLHLAGFDRRTET